MMKETHFNSDVHRQTVGDFRGTRVKCFCFVGVQYHRNCYCRKNMKENILYTVKILISASCTIIYEYILYVNIQKQDFTVVDSQLHVVFWSPASVLSLVIITQNIIKEHFKVQNIHNSLIQVKVKS